MGLKPCRRILVTVAARILMARTSCVSSSVPVVTGNILSLSPSLLCLSLSVTILSPAPSPPLHPPTHPPTLPANKGAVTHAQSITGYRGIHARSRNDRWSLANPCACLPASDARFWYLWQDPSSAFPSDVRRPIGAAGTTRTWNRFRAPWWSPSGSSVRVIWALAPWAPVLMWLNHTAERRCVKPGKKDHVKHSTGNVPQP